MAALGARAGHVHDEDARLRALRTADLTTPEQLRVWDRPPASSPGMGRPGGRWSKDRGVRPRPNTMLDQHSLRTPGLGARVHLPPSTIGLPTNSGDNGQCQPGRMSRSHRECAVPALRFAARVVRSFAGMTTTLQRVAMTSLSPFVAGSLTGFTMAVDWKLPSSASSRELPPGGIEAPDSRHTAFSCPPTPRRS